MKMKFKIMMFVACIIAIMSMLSVCSYYITKHKQYRKAIDSHRIIMYSPDQFVDWVPLKRADQYFVSELLCTLIAYKVGNKKLPENLNNFTDFDPEKIKHTFYSPTGFSDKLHNNEQEPWIVVFWNKKESQYILGKIKNGNSEIRVVKKNECSLILPQPTQQERGIRH